MLQLNFKIAQDAGSTNTAVDDLSKPQHKVSEKIRLKSRQDQQTTLIEVANSSSDVNNEEQVSFTQRNPDIETESQTFERKKQSRKKAAEWMANMETT